MQAIADLFLLTENLDAHALSAVAGWSQGDRYKAEARRAEAGKLAKPPDGVNVTRK